jgi:hypothetical protein
MAGFSIPAWIHHSTNPGIISHFERTGIVHDQVVMNHSPLALVPQLSHDPFVIRGPAGASESSAC